MDGISKVSFLSSKNSTQYQKRHETRTLPICSVRQINPTNDFTHSSRLKENTVISKDDSMYHFTEIYLWMNSIFYKDFNTWLFV